MSDRFAVTGNWASGPKAGDIYRSKQPQETRHVVDRTLGGGVVFVAGRISRHCLATTHTAPQWNEWIIETDAKCVARS